MHVLGRSAAVLTDETGFPPTFYDRSMWHVQGYGDLAELEKSYGDLAMKEVWAKYGKDHLLYNKSQAGEQICVASSLRDRRCHSSSGTAPQSADLVLVGVSLQRGGTRDTLCTRSGSATRTREVLAQ
jgi:hypothetical protein